MSEELERFIEITKVRRCSGFNQEIGRYLLDFAEKNHIEHRIDDVGNIVMIRPGSTGRIVILQAHQDMVAAVKEGSDFDFRRDRISASVDGDWIHANGTTLGADDGSGIALCLCALLEPKLKDVSMKCIFTVDEEIGLIGAASINDDWLSGDYLLNIDSESEDIITIGCAGCVHMVSTAVPKRESVSCNGYSLRISGLKGGHSACDIQFGRGNALLLAAEFISSIDGARLSSLTGGEFHNSIPSSSNTIFTVPLGTDINEILSDFEMSQKEKYRISDPDLSFKVEECNVSSLFEKGFSDRFIGTLLSLPNGILKKNTEGIVTSSNTGFIRQDNGTVTIANMPRSSDDLALSKTMEKITSVMDGLGAITEITGRGDSWYEPADTELVERSKKVYMNVFGKEPSIVVSHGGLECGTFRRKNPKLQQISFGPNIEGAHSIHERMSVQSLAHIKEFLYALIIDLTS